MPRRARGGTQMLAELAQVAPVVIGRRLLQTWPTLQPWSAAQRREIDRMASEKWLAGMQSGLALWTELAMAGSAMFWHCALAPWQPLRLPSTDRLLAATLQPVHRAATANARRLPRAARSRRG